MANEITPSTNKVVTNMLIHSKREPDYIPYKLHPILRDFLPKYYESQGKVEVLDMVHGYTLETSSDNNKSFFKVPRLPSYEAPIFIEIIFVAVAGVSNWDTKLRLVHRKVEVKEVMTYTEISG